MEIKISHFIFIISFILILFMSSCFGPTKSVPAPSSQVTQTSTILIKNTPSITVTSTITPTYSPSPPPTLTLTTTPTPDICSPTQWQENGIYLLSTDLFGALHPGGPTTFDRILIAQNSAWEDFRQEDHDEIRSAGVIFHERSFGHQLGIGVNPAVVLVTYGVKYDWELPKYGNLVSRVDQIRASLYKYEWEWFIGNVDQSQFPPIANGATYALFRYFDGNQNQLETWCRTYVDVYEESPFKEYDH